LFLRAAWFWLSHAQRGIRVQIPVAVRRHRLTARTPKTPRPPFVRRNKKFSPCGPRGFGYLHDKAGRDFYLVQGVWLAAFYSGLPDTVHGLIGLGRSVVVWGIPALGAGALDHVQRTAFRLSGNVSRERTQVPAIVCTGKI